MSQHKLWEQYYSANNPTEFIGTFMVMSLLSSFINGNCENKTSQLSIITGEQLNFISKV